MMRAPSASRSRGSSVFTVAAVPTGMKTGVSITPREVSSRPRRAAPSRASTWKRITRRVSPAGAKVSREPELRGVRAAPADAVHELLPGARRPPVRQDLEPDRAVAVRAGQVPADDGAEHEREETFLQQDGELVADERQLPGPAHRAAALRDVEGHDLDLRAPPLDRERELRDPAGRALLEGHRHAARGRGEEVRGGEAVPLELEVDAGRGRGAAHPPIG